jgi:predicted YcjX-like family ATPase
MIFSAINCTKTIHTRENGAYKSYLEGVIKDEEVKGTQTWDPGDVPDRFPDNGWDLGLYQFRDFAPVRVPLKHGATAPHINLDMLLGLMLESCL